MNRYEAYMAARPTPTTLEDTQQIKPGMQFLLDDITWTITHINAGRAYCTANTGHYGGIWVADCNEYDWLNR